MAVKQTTGVDYTEESHLLTPYFEHCVVEGKNELLPLLKYLLFGNLLIHNAKIANLYFA